jgi:hypothetical protein
MKDYAQFEIRRKKGGTKRNLLTASVGGSRMRNTAVEANGKLYSTLVCSRPLSRLSFSSADESIY